MSATRKTPDKAGQLRFKPYRAYKASGIEWLGEIPAHWEVKRIGDCAALTNDFPFDSQYFTKGIGIPLVRIRDLYGTETEISYAGPVNGCAWIETGDQRMCCLRPRLGYDDGFIAYLLPTPLKVVNDLAFGTTVKHLSSNDVSKIQFGVPPLIEQRAIRTFLDRQTSKIDEIVAKQEGLIELLREKRAATINRVVTQGLDPNVLTKDSGVEWLGEIPAHWGVKRLKHLARLNPESLGENTDPDLGITYVDIGGVDSLGRITERESLTFSSAPTRARRIVRDGDVVVSTVRTYLRAIAAIQDPGPHLVVSTGFTVVRPGDELITNYAAYALRTPYFVERVVANSTGVSFPATSEGRMATYEIAVPPEPEQRTIAAFLDRETAKIDGLMSRISACIERLKEYRKSLVFAAVTGKIDLRHKIVL